MGIFNQVQFKKPRYNNFSLSHDKKLSFQIGQLIPVLCAEMVPGDQFDLKSHALVRFMPLVSPVMHRFDVYLHNFFVPTRLLWPDVGENNGWEKFITGDYDGEDATVAPYCDIDALDIGELGDYLGLPIFASGTNDLRVLAFQEAGYRKIFSDYYRDENLNDAEEFVPLTDANNTSGNHYVEQPYNRAWVKDYFTSALPWTQRGPEATIPLGTTADLQAVNPSNPTLTHASSPGTVGRKVDGTSFAADDVTYNASSAISPYAEAAYIRFGGSPGQVDITGHTDIDFTNVEVDLSTASAATIIDLRNAFRLQEFLEKNARGGSRYIEIIMAHFGVRSSDARLQRAEFLGGSKEVVNISEVLQTSGTGITSQSTPQGNMSGHGISMTRKPRRISYRAEEHGYFYTIMSVLPKAAYQQGVHKQFTRFDKLDYYWPSFANIGEQPILNQELYWSETDALNEDVFGYTPRYAEYKYLPSTVSGQFRDTLDFWHAGRIFSGRPSLNNSFVTCQSAAVDRIFSVTTAADHKMWAHVYHDLRARRPMPYFGNPAI